MKKTTQRIISWLLTLVMVFQMTSVLEVITYAAELYETASEVISSEPEIIGEDISKREESVKHFKMSDGTYLAVSYGQPVHYRSENGSWQEIDNTLEESVQQIRVPMAAMDASATLTASTDSTVELSSSAYVNKSNNFGVSLPDKLNDQSWVGAFHMGHSLYFRFENINEADAVSSEPEMQEINTFERETTVHTSSSVTYENVLPGVDVLYQLNGQQLKENILFDSLDNTPESLSYILWAENLELHEAEDGSYIFTADDKVCFVLPAPYMVDSDGESSGTVQVAVEEVSEGTYRFTYLPDRQWLESTDRVWPVVLDPVTCATSSSGTIEDTYTRSGYPTYNYYLYSYVYTGYYSASTKNVRGFVQHNATPTLNSGDVVVKAQLHMTGRIYKSSGNMQVNAYAVTEEWVAEYTTWNTQPDAETETLDFQIVDSTSFKTYVWDVTSAVQRWYSGDLAGKGQLGKYGFMLAAPNDEDSGVVHIAQFYSSDTSGSAKPQLLIYYRNTTGIESYWDYTSASAGRAGTVAVNNYTGNLVVSRNDMAYSGNRLPASISFTYNTNDNAINIGYGNGWRSSYSQTVELKTIAGINYYCWTDGDGTRIYFYDDEGTWKDENGLEYTLSVASSSYTITDKDNNKLVFDSNGRLTSVIDGKISNNKIQIAYVSGTTTPKISTVTDGAGRKYSFVYGSDGNLSSITYKGSGSTSLESVSYTYSSNQLTKVTYADGNTATYAFSNGYMTSATGCQSDSITVSYSTGGTCKVKQVVAKDSGTTVSSASFIYGDNYTKVTDNNKRWCVYQFNNLGNTVSVYNQRGQALYGSYSDDTPNQLVNSSRLQDTVTNLLDTRTYSGSWSKNVTVTAGKTYTLSGTGTGSASKKLSLKVNGVTYSSDSVTTDRTEVTVTVPSGVTTLTASGTGAFTYLQLEQTESASRYNLLLDADMTAVTNWTGTNMVSGDGRSAAETGSRAHLDKYALLINGEGATAKQYKQVISVSGSKGDNYSFGAWVKAASAALDNVNSQNDSDPKRRFGIQVRLLNGNTLVEEKYIAANEACAEWQFISGSVQADGAYTKVEFSLIYDYNVNKAYFDGAQLFEEKFAYVYTYDDNGRISTVTDLDGNVTTYTYRGTSSDITSIKLPSGATYTYSYNSSNLLTGTTSATGVKTTHTYDSYGNNLKTTIGYSGNNTVIQSNQTYTDDGNFLKTVTGGDRNTVTYNYDTNKSTLTSATDPRGTATTNEYDTMRRLKSTASVGATASYTYNKDRLSKIVHSGGTNGTTYNFTYTTAGLTDKVSVGSDYKLVDNAYNSGTWTLASQVYGNGDAWYYTYNQFDDLVSAYTTGGNSGTELKYFYNSEGALARIEQYDTTLSGTSISARTLVSTERYYYDTADRMIRIVRTDADGDTYACSWEYDHNNNVTELVETINGTPTSTAYTYDADQRVKSIATGGTTTNYNYDGYGRIGSQVTKNGSTTVLTDSYSYRSPGSGLTSTQVATLAVTASGYSVTYQYEYDANGNITKVTNGGKETTYVYDALNQLTRENNEAAEKTWVWTYDAGGNITSRKEYNYTTGDLGDPISTINYTYDDAAWGDLLTAYSGTEISHDGIGNPLNDGTWTYTWDGRQLASMTSDSTTWSYKYNADGLRTERSNGSTTYEYVYSGSSLVHMSVGSNLLYFTYDGSVPMTVTYNGEVYYYVTNLQGDVAAILDGSGNAVVQYSYDAWGSILSTTGALADTLGQHNPLRYRGYVYDIETGLYYVSSRYYDPEIGRFINADAVDLLGANGDFASLNLFAYCGNNPVSREDPSGGLWVTAGLMAVGGLIGAAISAVSSAVTQQALTGTVNWKSVGVAAASGFVSGAVAASPLGIVGQQIAGGVIGGLSYAADCYVNDKAMKLDEAILSVGMGVVSGRIGGSGANEKMVLSNAAKSAKQTIARESRRANQQYAQKVIAATISSRNNTFASTAWVASFRFAAGTGISNGATGKYSSLELFPNAPTWKPW